MKRWIAFCIAIGLLLLPHESFAATIADGTYDVGFRVLKEENTEASMADDYLEKPAKVTVQNGKATVQMVLKNSSWWKEFKVEGKAVRTVSEADDVRVVEFDVADLTQMVKANIHVIVPDINYDNHYVIRFDFDTSGLAKDEPSASGNAETSVVTSAEASDGTEAEVVNPKTSDQTPILALIVLLIFSSYFLIKQYTNKIAQRGE